MTSNGTDTAFATASIPRVNGLAEKLRLIFSIMALLVLDFVMIAAAIRVVLWLRVVLLVAWFPDWVAEYNWDSVSPLFLNVLIPLIMIGFIAYEGLYSRRLPFWQGAEKLFKATFFSFLFVMMVFFLVGSIADKSRIIFLLLWPCSFLFLALGRWVGKIALAKLGLWSKAVLLIGAGPTAEMLMKHYFHDPAIGYRVVGILEDRPWDHPLCQEVPYLGKVAEAEAVIRQTGIQEVLVAEQGLNREQLLGLIYRLQRWTRRVSFVPDLIGVPLSNLEMDTVFSEKALLLHVRNNLSEPLNRFVKRFMDLALGVPMLIFSLPFFLVIALAIRLETAGSPLFVHSRIGRGGKRFPCLKFRTMRANADRVLADMLEQDPVLREEWQQSFKLRHDPRVTRLGHFLRESSLDELPQLLNVILGQMSLVGPRPIIQAEIEKYGSAIEDYFAVRPGLSGLWQVSGRNDLSYAQRVELDSWYVRNWSPWLDLTLLFRTFTVVLGRRGAY